MKIGEVIERLQRIQAEQGDIPVAIPGHHESNDWDSNITVDVINLRSMSRSWSGDLTEDNYSGETHVVIY